MKSILTVGILLCCQYLFGQQKTRLNNDWQFVKQDLGGIWEAVRAVKKGNPEEVPLWTNVTLPHCVNAEDAVDPDVNYYQGPAWYRTQLKIKNPYPGGRTLLHFEGAGQKSTVYVNTTLVGSHVGGYDEWTVDITDAVDAFRKNAASQKELKIPVAIRTDNSRDLEMIPSDLSDFNLYGGLYRYVNLVYVPALSFEHLFVQTETDKDGRAGRLSLRARFYNPLKSSNATVAVKLLDPKGRVVQQLEKKLADLSGDIAIGEISVKSPQLWSTELPALYTVQTTIQDGTNSCTRVEKTGFRNFEFIQKGPFMLNGKRLLLRGTQRHEDGAGVAAALTEDMIRTEFLLMKDMGVNFIRLGHYQNSRIALELCDSLGILVWEEIPWCRGGLGGDVFKAQARRMLTNMIEQHYNSPSVIIWGIGNENDWPGDFPTFDTIAIRNFMSELNTISHQLDPSRKTAIRRCDFCKDIVDVYSPSIWAGWYRGIYTEYKDVSRAEFERVKHFLHAEWGGDSHARRHSETPDKALQKVGKAGAADERSGDASLFGGAARVSKDGDWSESYICNLFDWHLKEQETMPWLTGAAQWIFKDFSTPVRPDNPVPYMNQKGLLERDFTKKEAYYVFQSYWTNKPMLHIYGHSMPVRWGDEGETKMVKVYSNCEEAELFLNGKSLGKKRRNSQDFPAAGLRWETPMHKGNYTIKVVGRKGKEQVSDQINFEYRSEKWGKPAKATLHKMNEQNGICTIEIKLFDAKGVQCLDAVNWVRFALAGDGKLIDNQGTSTGSRYVQMYNGRAIIRVQANGGKSVVSTKVDGVPAAFVEL
ncbi:glycoside hydrolase family 2 TIM barrel-domain containing protein [Segetibacter sp. 3557_3]|uniref:glycoside hydrolase family 2 TIM barrel-domain containing protein n=1 Tax=Segetibacter sp. 3557_3 TaxID=2547429 RepID=UPI001FB605DB|nr:glycoside hydrolase family 2 TIM barrel-domain containing protein [Segetibacter sp. 3557_3]